MEPITLSWCNKWRSLLADCNGDWELLAREFGAYIVQQEVDINNAFNAPREKKL